MIQKLSNSPLHIFAIVVTLKLILFFIVLLLLGSNIVLWGDSPLYIDLGRNIFSGNGFSSSMSDGSLVSNIVRTPIYPFLIGFFDTFIPHGIIFLIGIQIVVASASTVLIYNIGKMFIPSIISMFVAFAYAFEPVLAVLHMLALPDTLHVFFILLFSYTFLSYMNNNKIWYLLFSGFILAVSVLTKPITLYLFVIPIGVMIGHKKPWRAIIAVLVIFIVTLAPWAYRNYLVTGTVDITGNDHKNICAWGLVGVFSSAYHLDSSNWAEAWAIPEYAEKEAMCTSTGQAVKIFLKDYPLASIKTLMLSSLAFLTNEGYTTLFEKDAEHQVKIHHNYLTPAVFTNADWVSKVNNALKEFTYIERIVILLGKMFWVSVLGGAIYSIVRLIRDPHLRLWGIYVLSVILYFTTVTVISTAFGVSARLRHPVDPFLFLLAGYALYTLYESRKKIQ